MVQKHKIISMKHFCILILLFTNTLALARFEFDDSRLVDRESSSSELIIDKQTYQFPLLFDEKWNSSRNGFRASIGSLNANRFYYKEQTKFQTQNSGVVNFSFHRQKEQDLNEAYSDDVLKLSFRTPLGFTASILGSGDTYKDRGDLGVSLEAGNKDSLFVEVYYFATDVFFNEKTELEGYEYKRYPRSIGTRFHLSLGGFDVEGRGEWDTPTELITPIGDYEYRRHEVHVLATRELSEKSVLGLMISEADKFESQIDDVENGSEKFQRQSAAFQTFYLKRGGRPGYFESYRFTFEKRDAESEFLDNGALTNFDLLHYEWGLSYQNQTISVFENSHFLWGLFLNQPWFEELSSRQLYSSDSRLESKLQLALETRVGEYGKMLWNTSWDLDSLYQDALLEGESVSPWDGGNVQFQITF